MARLRVKIGLKKSLFNFIAFGILMAATIYQAPSQARTRPFVVLGGSEHNIGSFPAPTVQNIVDWFYHDNNSPNLCSYSVTSSGIIVTYNGEEIKSFEQLSDAKEFLRRNELDCTTPASTKLCKVIDGDVMYANSSVINVNGGTSLDTVPALKQLNFCNKELPAPVGPCQIKLVHVGNDLWRFKLYYNGNYAGGDEQFYLSTLNSNDSSPSIEDANRAFNLTIKMFKRVSNFCKNPTIGNCKLLAPGEKDRNGNSCDVHSPRFSYTDKDGVLGNTCTKSLEETIYRMLMAEECQ